MGAEEEKMRKMTKKKAEKEGELGERRESTGESECGGGTGE